MLGQLVGQLGCPDDLRGVHPLPVFLWLVSLARMVLPSGAFPSFFLERFALCGTNPRFSPQSTSTEMPSDTYRRTGLSTFGGPAKNHSSSTTITKMTTATPTRPVFVLVSSPPLAHSCWTGAMQTSENKPSRHSGEAFSTVPHPPNLGRIGQTVNARGCAYATCCVLANTCSTPTQWTRLWDSLLLTYC